MNALTVEKKNLVNAELEKFISALKSSAVVVVLSKFLIYLVVGKILSYHQTRSISSLVVKRITCPF